MTMPSQEFAWLNLSSTRPSYSLVCGQATGKEEWQIVKRNGIYMTKEKAQSYDKTHFDIMALPYDIRHEILSLACEKSTMPVFLRRGFYGLPPNAIPLPKLAHAGDRKLRLETILVTIKQTTLEIHSGPGNTKLQPWLTSIDLSICGQTSLKSAFEAVHSLSLPYFSRFPHANLPANALNNDIELMVKCPNLRKLRLNFVNQELVYFDSNGYQRAKSLTRLRREYRLDSMLKIFEHGELKEVLLDGPPTGTHGHEALIALGAWFRAEYALRANFRMTSITPTKSAKSLSVLVQ